MWEQWRCERPKFIALEGIQPNTTSTKIISPETAENWQGEEVLTMQST